MWGGAYIWGSATLPILRKRSSPILGVYAYTCCCRTTKFDVVTHVGRSVYLGVSHVSHPKGAESSGILKKMVHQIKIAPACVWIIKRPLNGRGLGQVTQFPNFGTLNNNGIVCVPQQWLLEMFVSYSILSTVLKNMHLIFDTRSGF